MRCASSWRASPSRCGRRHRRRRAGRPRRGRRRRPPAAVAAALRRQARSSRSGSSSTASRRRMRRSPICSRRASAGRCRWPTSASPSGISTASAGSRTCGSTRRRRRLGGSACATTSCRCAACESVEFTGTLGLDRRACCAGPIADRYGAPPAGRASRRRGAHARGALSRITATSRARGACPRRTAARTDGQHRARPSTSRPGRAGEDRRRDDRRRPAYARAPRSSSSCRSSAAPRTSRRSSQRKLDEFTQKLRKRGFYEATASAARGHLRGQDVGEPDDHGPVRARRHGRVTRAIRCPPTG